jgi:glutaredoxin
MFSARLGVAAFGGTSAAAVLVFSSKYNTASADKAPASAAVRAAAMGKLPELTLYQYDPCPFCCKVKAFLDANDVPYKCVEVDPVWKKQLAFSVGYQKVPVLMVGDEQVNDSDNIIDTLTDRLKLKEGGDTTATPPTTAATDLITIDPSSGEEGERKWRNWVYNSLV